MNIIREQRIPDGQELQTYEAERPHEFGGFQNEEEQLDDFDRWLQVGGRTLLQENAAVYELFIDGNGKLLCTLNGEAGEDFDEPIGQVQTEGLLEIAHWLEEHGFISADVNDDGIVVCEECGSDNIQTQAWVNPNARTFIGTTGIDRYDNWCECEDHQSFITLREFKERMQEWWDSLDENQMEQITGYRQGKRPAGDNHQGLPKPAMNGGKTRAMTRNVKSGKNITTADYDLQSS